MQENGFISELKDRRVIRAVLLYVAFAWVALQAADLFAEAEFISEKTVRWLILGAAIGFPITVIGSWFLDSPWRASKKMAVAGDIVIIAAISLAAILFVWQQWFVSFVRPTLVVQTIVATDTRAESQRLADRLAKNLRTLLAMRPEVRVLEFGSSAAGVHYRIAGTLARSASSVRVTVQLFESGDDLAWSDTFEGQLAGEDSLINRIQAELWARLPLEEGALKEAQALVSNCESFAERDDLLATAQRIFDEMGSLPPPQRPVRQQLAMQYLQDADTTCPGWPDTELMRLENTLQLEHDRIDDTALLSRYPNSSLVHRKIAERRQRDGDEDEARALYAEACKLQPDPALPYCT